MARLISKSRAAVLATALVVAYAAGLAAYLFGFLGPVGQAEQATLDWRFLYRGPVGEKARDVVIVTVDEEADLPYWAPMPRTHLAQVIRSLHRGGVRLIGLDFFLGERSFDREADSLLQEAIRQAGNVVLVSYLDREPSGALEEHLPLPYFLDAALDYGYATFFTDTGVESVREGTAAVEVENRHALSLAGCLYAHLQDLSTREIRQLPWRERHRGLPAPEDEYRRIINYTGPPFQFYRRQTQEMPGGIAAFSSHQVAAFPPPLAQRFFAGKTVLVGSGLTDAPDRYRTPFFSRAYEYEKTFGVEVHAHLLHTFLASASPESTGFFSSAILVLLPAFLAGLAAIRLRPHRALPLTVLMVLLLWAMGFVLFDVWSLVVPLVTSTLSTGLACLFGLAYLASTEGKQKDEVRDRFGPMLGPAQLREVLDTPEAWASEGEERMVSVLWVHLHAPRADGIAQSGRETVAFFQRYWERVSGIVFKHNGAVFRYEADGLAAVFGAPLPLPQQAVRAALAAVDLAEAWLVFRKECGIASWTLCMGADTGQAIVGELGAGERHAYRVLGNPVNRARFLAESQEGAGEIYVTRALKDQAEALVATQVRPAVKGQEVYCVTGRTKALQIGAADRPADPFWKYLGLGNGKSDGVSEEGLGRLSIFAHFTRRELRRIRPALFRRAYQAGERIFSRGEVGSAMYIILSGQVDILQESEAGQPELLQRLGPGDFFGELALLSDQLRPASAVAYEPAELLVLFQADLYELVEREPELGVRLVRALSRILGERLVLLYDELVRIRRKDV